MAHVEILDVVPAGISPEDFWGSGIDMPRKGERRDHYAMLVAGWVLHRDLESPEILAVSEGQVVARWPSNRLRPDVATAYTDMPISPCCGFMGAIRTLDLPAEFELRIEMLGRNEQVLLGTIVGRRTSLQGSRHERLRPAPVITLGRTGSTLLMQLLGQHPRILVHPPFPYEARLAAYWSAVFAELSSPASYLQALAPAYDRRFWWVGYLPFPTETYLDQDAAARSLGGESLEAMASFARRQAASFYEASAVMQRKAEEGPAWFAEKQIPQPDRQRLQFELFPESRAIYLVRDFRDVLASIMAFNRKRGGHSFGRRVEDDDDRYAARLADAIADLLSTLRRAGNRGMLVRYEDLVHDPTIELARILEFLDLERSKERIQAMVAAADASERDARALHRTSPDASASIDRYRRDLPPHLIERCETLFGDALALCGYRATTAARRTALGD